MLYELAPLPLVSRVVMRVQQWREDTEEAAHPDLGLMRIRDRGDGDVLRDRISDANVVHHTVELHGAVRLLHEHEVSLEHRWRSITANSLALLVCTELTPSLGV